MRIGFWVNRFLLVAIIVFAVLVAVELAKGHGAQAAIRFAWIWSLITTAVFIGTRIFYVSRGKNCPMCNDLPK